MVCIGGLGMRNKGGNDGEEGKEYTFVVMGRQLMILNG